MKRKNILLILTLLLNMVLSKVIAYDALVDGIYYNLDGTSATVTYRSFGDKNAYIGHVIIPEHITYGGKQYSVTSIGDDAFNECRGLTSVNIPNSVATIGRYGFANCTGLTYIAIPQSVTSIGWSAFNGCTGLTSITIPNSVTTIEVNVVAACSNLEKIEIANGNKVYDSRDNCNAIIVTATNELIAGCKKTVIPNSVTSIGDRAFYCCTGLTSITIPNSVTNIEFGAFSGCENLSSITIPNSVSCIGYSSFSNTPWYKNQPDGVVYAGKVAYTYKGTMPIETSIVLNDGTLGISDYAFSRCGNLTSIIIPNSVTNIGKSVFEGCTGLTSITIPDSVTSIGDEAFYGCTNLTSISIPNSVNSIGVLAFYGTPWYNNQPDGVVYAGKVAYTYKGKMPTETSIVLNDGTLGISDVAFGRCGNLTSITIPNSVIYIGSYAFSNCNALVSVVLGMAEPLSINSNVFTSATNTTLYVPKNSKALYSSSEVWKDFKAIKEYPNSDVNEDSYVDVVDVVDIARYVVGTPSAQFDDILADLNQDKTVSVADAVLVVKEIVGETNWARRFNGVSDNRGVLTLTCNDDRSLSLCMEDDGQYTAFQFDLMVPEDGDVRMQLNTLRRQGHQLIYNKVGDGHYRVVALSLNNNAFGGQQGEVLNIQLDGLDGRSVTFDNIHFVTLRGTDHRFDALSASGATTGVQGASAREQGASAVYRLNGTKQRDSQRGVNIVRGKKYIER